MNDSYPTPYLGVVPLLSFGFSVIAAVLAIDMYRLLRTGQSGVAWRVLIIASVVFALAQTLHFGEMMNFAPLADTHLPEICELIFVISLAYAFHLQRRAFTDAARFRQSAERSTHDESPEETTAPGWRQEPKDLPATESGYTPLVASVHEDEDIEWEDTNAATSNNRH